MAAGGGTRAGLSPHSRHGAAEAAQATGDYQYRQDELRQWRVRWIAYLVDTKQTDRARTELEALPENMRTEYAVNSLEIRIAAQRGTLAALIERYEREPDKAPAFELLRDSAALLRKNGDDAGARRVLEFAYTRELDRRNFSAANFLGLAELRLETGDTAAAVTLLRRMTLVANEPFEDLEPAADLLSKYGRTTEARQFLSERVKAVPWDLGARVKLGDASVAAAPEAPYSLRAQAALLKPAAKTGSAELDLLASGAVAPAAAEQPFFYHARVKAAATTADAAARIRLLLGALAIDPNANEARLALFRAALAGGNYQLAISSVEPMLETMRYVLNRPNRDEEVDLTLLRAAVPGINRARLPRARRACRRARRWHRRRLGVRARQSCSTGSRLRSNPRRARVQRSTACALKRIAARRTRNGGR